MDLLLFAQETPDASGIPWGIYVPFAVLHFLEFAIWGSWYVILGNYLNALGFSRSVIGRIYGTMPLGAIISPMILGTIADKYLNTEIVLAISHLAGAVLLFLLSRVRRPGLFFVVALLYALVYSPTLSLVNSIVFANFADAGIPSENFAYIRVFGTIGWIAAGLSLKLLLKPNQPVDNKPILLAAGLSAALGAFSFLLPATPPAAEASALPFVKALSLIGDPAFAIFFGVTLVIAMGMAFYFAFTGIFLEQKVKVNSENIGPVLAIGQFVEIFFMVSLPWFIATVGVPTVLVVGVTAWALRFGFFSTGVLPLVIAGVALHGLCFDFFFATGFIYMEQETGATIRASAQSLYGVIVYGLGMYLGTEASGWLNQRLTREEAPATEGTPPIRTTNWSRFWLIPSIVVAISLAALIGSLLMAPEPTVPDDEAAAAAAELPVEAE